MRFVYIRHALKMLVERDIDRTWVERTVIEPEETEPDPHHVRRTRAFRSVPERDGRVLRVIRAARRSNRDRNGVPGSRPEAKTMRTEYDPDADALYLRFADAPVVETEEVRPGVMLDFDAEGRIVAIEVLDASRHLASGSNLMRLAAA